MTLVTHDALLLGGLIPIQKVQSRGFNIHILICRSTMGNMMEHRSISCTWGSYPALDTHIRPQRETPLTCPGAVFMQLLYKGAPFWEGGACHKAPCGCGLGTVLSIIPERRPDVIRFLSTFQLDRFKTSLFGCVCMNGKEAGSIPTALLHINPIGIRTG